MIRKGAFGSSVLAHKAAADLYIGLNDGDNINSVLKRAVATFMLANEFVKFGEKEKSLELYLVTLNYIKELDGDDTFEAAATSVYIGTKHSSVDHLKRALQIYKEKALLSELDKESNYCGMGQEAIILKYMAMRKYSKNEFKIAFTTISSAICIFEQSEYLLDRS